MDSIETRLGSESRTLTVRPQVYEMARLMEMKLRGNDHKVGWAHMSNGTIVSRIHGELKELSEALASGDPAHIGSEGADVNNFVMFLLDNNGALSHGRSLAAEEVTGDVRKTQADSGRAQETGVFEVKCDFTDCPNPATPPSGWCKAHIAASGNGGGGG